jgi:hypothetical protein
MRGCLCLKEFCIGCYGKRMGYGMGFGVWHCLIGWLVVCFCICVRCAGAGSIACVWRCRGRSNEVLRIHLPLSITVLETGFIYS